MDLYILSCKYFFEISLPFDVLDSCHELIVNIDCVHVKVKHQYIDLFALSSITHSNASIKRQVTSSANRHKNLLKNVYHCLNKQILLDRNILGYTAIYSLFDFDSTFIQIIV